MQRQLTGVLILVLCSATVLLAEDDSKLHKFELWGIFNKAGASASDLKMAFFWGLTDGLMTGASLPFTGIRPPGSVDWMSCVFLSKTLSTKQAIAMIDKYYREHPEKWSMSIGDAIVEALTVKGGPCEADVPHFPFP